ncbi:AraC-like DNA-binding protein [Paenibacillus amylolyticus]|uniref:AraC-like DNA-binding protein n=1 Tax=Paenibacillus amylolyticus TaxID=1451 RepID=A0AAP5H5S8_PAEAM|nr:AraC family transcriptional regulator [Paenibacillus amylolyticus]MDR6724471.1 AraC-like DNA-binding protein [Paenibacillus amylolyticus]
MSSNQNQSPPLKVGFLRIKDEPFRWSNSIEVVIVLEGSIQVAIADENRILSVGGLEIFNINQVHRLSHTHEENLVLLINIDAEFAKDHCSDLSKVWFAHEFGPGTYLGSERVKEITEAICTLITPVVNNQSELRFLTLLNIIKPLLDLLITNLDVKRMFEGNPIKLQRIWKIYDYLFNNQGYTNKASLNEIAEMTDEYLNLDYLSSQFKLLIGDTLQNLLHYLRIEHAIKRLLTTNLSLVDISVESGFSSPRYFYQKFNKIFPEGPKEFRHVNKKKQEMMEHCREIIDPAFVLPRHEGLFHSHEAVSNVPNKWINLDLFGYYDPRSTSVYMIGIADLIISNSDNNFNRILQVHDISSYQVFGFEEPFDFTFNKDVQSLTWFMNQFSDNDIHPAFIVGADSKLMSEQIAAIQRLIENYALIYGAEHLKGWKIEIR